MALNKKMIASLGVDLPEEAEEVSTLPVPDPIHPGEVVKVDNPELPTMEDIEINLIESERQIDHLIQMGFGMIEDLKADHDSIAPNYRNAHLERLITVFQSTADIVKYKADLQLNKKKARLNEAKFLRPAGKKTEAVEGTSVVQFNFNDIVKSLIDARDKQSFESVETVDSENKS